MNDEKQNVLYLYDLLQIIKLNIKYILLISLIITISTSIISLLLQDQYKSSMIARVVVLDDSSNLNIPSQYGALASIAGINMPIQNQDRSAYVIETLKSKDFLKKIIQIPLVLENLIAIDKYIYDENKIIYDSNIYDSKTKTWVRVPDRGRSIKPSYIEVYESFHNIFRVTQSKETGYLDISVTHQSPIFAHDLLKLILKRINQITLEKDLQESTASLEYLELILEKTPQPEIRELISLLIESEIKKQMMMNINEFYALEPIDQAFIPEIKHSPKRLRISVLSFILSFIFSIFFVVLRRLIIVK